MVLYNFPTPLGDPVVAVEDEDFLVVQKPAGTHTSVGPASRAVPSEKSLLSWVLERYPEVGGMPGRGGGEGGLLHRLDRETSGLVLFARNQEAFRALSGAAGSGQFLKEYILRSRPSPEGLSGCRPERVAPAGVDEREWEAAERRAGLIAKALGEGREVAIRSLFRAYGPGAVRVACAALGADLGKKKREWGQDGYRTAILEVRPSDGEGALELRVSLTRGFRHQIRAHLAWAGLPLLGDAVYGGAAADRLYLHSAALKFPHPRTGRAIVVES